MTPSSRRQSTVGEIVNLMSVDAQKFVKIMTSINLIWSCPLQIILSMVMLWEVLGPSCLAGLAVMVLLTPMNAYVGKRIEKLQVSIGLQ